MFKQLLRLWRAAFAPGIFGIDDIAFAALVGGGLSFLGAEDTNDSNQQISSANNEFNANQAQLARQFNAEQAQENRGFQSDEARKLRDFQTAMSNTSYQRAVGDLRSAGLNPMLAYHNGGASTPAGAMASGSSASGPSASSAGLPQRTNALGAGITSAFDAASKSAAIQNMKATNENIRANSGLINAQTQKAIAEAESIRTLMPAQLSQYSSSARSLDIHSDLAYAQIANVHQELKRLAYSTDNEQKRGRLLDVQRDLVDAQAKYAKDLIPEAAFNVAIAKAVAALRGLEIPLAVNLANSESTWWKQNIAPFLGDASKAVGTAAGAAAGVFGIGNLGRAGLGAATRANRVPLGPIGGTGP